MTTKKKEDLLREQQAEEERKKSGEKPAEPSAVQKAQEELEIARARTEASALAKGYPMPDPVEAWYVDMEQKNKKLADEQKKNLEDAAKNKSAADQLKVDADALARSVEDNNKRQKELEDGLREIAIGKQKIAEVYESAQKEAVADLNNFRQRVGGKTIGNIEEAMRTLSVVKSSLVKRTNLSFSCTDCHKENAKSPERQASWDIPTLDFLTRVKNASYDAERDEWKLGDGFGLCGDCEQQESGRVFPVTICDICPIRELVIKAIDNIVVGLTLSGVSIRWDADGIYIPHLSIKEQGDIPNKEWVKKILIDTNLSDVDIEQKTTAAIGKLGEGPQLDEPVDLSASEAASSEEEVEEEENG